MNSLRTPTTSEEKLALIRSLRTKFHRKRELLLPDSELYPGIYDSSTVTLAGKKICVWLGVKPTDLSFHADPKSKTSFLKYDGKYHINISGDYAKNPFVGCPILINYCIEYALTKKHFPCDVEIVEKASIELGFGLLYVNAINSDHSFRSSFYRLVQPSGLSVNSNVLRYYSPTEYLREFNNFVSTNELSPVVVYEHALPWAQRHLSRLTVQQSLQPEDFVRNANNKITKQRFKIVGSTFLIVICLSISVVLWSNGPKKLSPELQVQKDNIEVLEMSYNKCMSSLKSKQKTYDTNDIFMIRQLDAHLSRCASLRNTHDYEVNSFNSSLQKAGLTK